MLAVNKQLIKWLIVIIILLLIPQGSLIVIAAFSFFYIIGKLDKLDLLLAYFLVFFIQQPGDSETGSGGTLFKFILLGLPLLAPERNFSILSLFRQSKIFVIFLIYLIFNSLAVSFFPSNSLVEFITFMLLLAVTYKCTYFDNIEQRENKLNNIRSLFLAVIAASLLAWPFAEIAYKRNGYAFQGVSLHPNVFGVVMAPIAGYLLITLITEFNYKKLLMFLLILVMMFFSQSRTALLSLFIGTVLYFVINRKLVVTHLKKIITALYWGVLLLLIYFTHVSNLIYSFLLKSKETSSIQSAVLISRGKLIDREVANIKKYPIFGIGFKTPSTLSMADDALSIGKAYEKGNIFLASFEELGIIGLLLLIISLISLIKFNKNGNSNYLIVAIVALLTTLGEASLFAIGGVGVIVWTFIFFNIHNFNFTKYSVEKQLNK